PRRRSRRSTSSGRASRASRTTRCSRRRPRRSGSASGPSPAPLHANGPAHRSRTHNRGVKRALTRARELVAALRRRPRLLQILEVTVAVVVVAICTWGVRGEWSKAWPELRDARVGYVALAFATVAAYYLVFILGWIRILNAWGIRVSYSPALQAEMVSMLAKYIPGAVWTPAARVAALSRLTGETRIATILASILVEAVLSAISGIVVFVVSLAWVPDVDAPLVPLVAFALLCLALLHPRIFGPLTRRLTRPFGYAPIEPLPFSLI